jgi:CHAD domain-containing protein
MNAIKSKTSSRSQSRIAPHSNHQESFMVSKLGLKRLRRFSTLISRAGQMGKPKIIHDIRVASRRVQQILDYLYPTPRPPAIRRLRSRLRRSRRILGKLRDYDVFIAAIDQRLKSKRLAQRQAWTAIHDRLKQRRIKLMKKARERFDKEDVPGLCSQLNSLLNTGDLQTGAEQPPPPRPEAMVIALKRLWQDFSDEVAESLREPRPVNIHGVRIKAKRLRYLLEVVEELDNPNTDTALIWLRRLQQRLGDWHDLKVQEKILLNMNSRRPVLSTAPQDDSLSDLIDNMRAVKTDIERAYLQMVDNDREWAQLRLWMTKHLAS